MDLVLTRDLGLISEVMLDKEILSKINTDNLPTENIKLKQFPDNATVLAVFVDKLIGLHVFTKKEGEFYYHPMLLKAFRGEFGREFFNKGLEWFKNNVSSASLYAEIPVSHKSTINLAKHLGFESVAVENDKQVLRLA